MADVTIKSVDEMESIYGGGMVRVRAALGVTSMGIQVLRMPANYADYPEHTHLHDEQEEVYIPLRGSVLLDLGDEQHELSPGTYARIGPGQKRKFIPGDDGVELLCLGGTPGKAYMAPEFTEEGAPAKF